jgi:YgiT-type zinc finger domain-containing protein
MKCLHCGGELKQGTVPFSIERNDVLVHWHARPAWICTQCGEPLFEKEEVDRMQRILQKIDDEGSRSKVA